MLPTRRYILGILVFGYSFFITSCFRPLSLHQRAARERRVESLINLSVKMLRANEPNALDQADSALELARELSPNDPRIIDGLGCVAWRKRQYAQAEESFLRALQADPNYDRAYSHLALLAERQGDRDRALELFRHALSLNPLNYRARNNYAVFLALESEQEAYGELLKALHSGPADDAVLKRNQQIFEDLRTISRR